MIYLVILGICIAATAVVFFYVAKRALSPREIYQDRRSSVPLMRCRHCDAVVTRRDIHEHGVNCPKRPDRPSS